jgi:hypothetical protein
VYDVPWKLLFLLFLVGLMIVGGIVDSFGHERVAKYIMIAALAILVTPYALIALVHALAGADLRPYAPIAAFILLLGAFVALVALAVYLQKWFAQ